MDRAAVTAVLDQFIGRKITHDLLQEMVSALKMAGLGERIDVFETGPNRLTVNVTKGRERQVFIVGEISVNI